MLAALVLLLSLQASHTTQNPPKAEGDSRELDLTVERCVELALQNNPDLSSLAFLAQASDGSRTQAEGDFDPIFAANASFARSRDVDASTFNVVGSTTSSSRYDVLNMSLAQKLGTGAQYSLSLTNRRSEYFPQPGSVINPNIRSTLSLSVTQPLFRGAWSTYANANVRSAEMEKVKAEKSFDDKVMSTIQSVHNAYWDLVFAIEDVSVKQFSLSLGEKLLEINQKKVKEGVSAPVEVLQAETEIAVRREALITAENARQAAEDSLKQLVFPFREHSEWNFRIRPGSQVPEVQAAETPSWDDALATAMALRPDLHRARIDLEEKNLSVDVAQSELLPKLDLSATGSNSAVRRYYQDILDDLEGSDFPAFSVGLSFEVPIGNRGAKGKLRAAEASRSAALQSLRALENLVAREVRDAIRNLQYQREKLAATQKSHELAQKQLEAEERKFEVGLSTNFQVLQFQQDLVQAITNEKSALLNHAKALIGLKKSQGQLRP